jgi:hypothetical protein
MRLPSLRTWRMPLVVGEEAYQEFTVGTIPVRRVMTHDPDSLVLVEHDRGFMPVFDEHLAAVRRREAPIENVDYVATWTGMTGDAARPAVIRLELKIDGLRARPRLLSRATRWSPCGCSLTARGSGWCSIPAATDPCPRWSASGCLTRPPPGPASVES